MLFKRKKKKKKKIKNKGKKSIIDFVYKLALGSTLCIGSAVAIHYIMCLATGLSQFIYISIAIILLLLLGLYFRIASLKYDAEVLRKVYKINVTYPKSIDKVLPKSWVDEIEKHVSAYEKLIESYIHSIVEEKIKEELGDIEKFKEELEKEKKKIEVPAVAVAQQNESLKSEVGLDDMNVKSPYEVTESVEKCVIVAMSPELQNAFEEFLNSPYCIFCGSKNIYYTRHRNNVTCICLDCNNAFTTDDILEYLIYEVKKRRERSG